MTPIEERVSQHMLDDGKLVGAHTRTRMVVKPLDWLATGKHGLVQPAVICRGHEYLRIIYGPEYTLPEHLERCARVG